MRVPRWRTKILPGFASCPPKSLTPKYFGLESVRFLAVPPAFLLAIYCSKLADMPDLSKWHRKLGPFILPAVVVLVGLTAFGLGRLSVECSRLFL